jgi:peroxiredoxin
MASSPLHTPLNSVVTRPLLDFARCFSPECFQTHVPAFFMELNNILKNNLNRTVLKASFNSKLVNED